MGHSDMQHLVKATPTALMFQLAIVDSQAQFFTPAERVVRAEKFMMELLEKYECLAVLADRHGVKTLVDVAYLQGAIMKGTFIDYYRDSSELVPVLLDLPSGAQWLSYIDLIEE